MKQHVGFRINNSALTVLEGKTVVTEGFKFSRYFKSIESYIHHKNRQTYIYGMIGAKLFVTSVRIGKLFVNSENLDDHISLTVYHSISFLLSLS